MIWTWFHSRKGGQNWSAMPRGEGERQQRGWDKLWPRQHSISIRGNMNNKPRRCGPRSKNAIPRADVRTHAFVRDSCAIYTVPFILVFPLTRSLTYIWLCSSVEILWYEKHLYYFPTKRKRNYNKDDLNTIETYVCHAVCHFGSCLIIKARVTKIVANFLYLLRVKTTCLKSRYDPLYIRYFHVPLSQTSCTAC